MVALIPVRWLASGYPLELWFSWEGGNGESARYVMLKGCPARPSAASGRGVGHRDSCRIHSGGWEQMALLEATERVLGTPPGPDTAWTTLRDGRSAPGLAAIGQGVATVRETIRQAPGPAEGAAVSAARADRRPRPECAYREVIAQLTTIQAGHPGAEVRQGPGHHLEIWPAPSRPEPPGHQRALIFIRGRRPLTG